MRILLPLLLGALAAPASACPAPYRICVETDALVENLVARSVAVRRDARRTLRALGRRALPALLRAKAPTRRAANAVIDRMLADLLASRKLVGDLRPVTTGPIARLLPGYRILSVHDGVIDGHAIATPDGRLLVLNLDRPAANLKVLGAELARGSWHVEVATREQAATVGAALLALTHRPRACELHGG